MKRIIIAISCLMLLSSLETNSVVGFGASACARRSSIAVGEWWGGFEFNNNLTVLKIRFSEEGGELKGRIAQALPPWGPTGALDQVSLRSLNLHFESPVNNGSPIIFEGQLESSGELITGSVQSGSLRGTFQLLHTVILEDTIFDQYVGEYQIGHGSYVSISRPPPGEPSAGIQYTVHNLSNPNQRSGNLFPISEGAFVAGPGRWVPHPVEINAAFFKNEKGEVVLKWKPIDSAEVVGNKVKPHLWDEEEVKFSNGNITLAGTLSLPLTKGPHPAVILISGSDGGLRGRGLPQFFAQHGIAALAYDKRGFGSSTGTILGATINDMAGDAAAGVRYLQKRADIAPTKVGVWSISQGGWMAPVVAITTRNVAFIILHAGPAVSPRLQGRMELISNLAGLSQQELGEAIAYHNLYMDAMNSDEAYDKVQAAYERLRQRGVRWVWRPAPKEQLRAQWTAPNVDFEPVPVLEKVKCPVLAFFGGKDGLVPPEGNVSIMEAALKKAGNKDFTIKVLPGVNHNFQLAGMGSWGFQSSGKTPPGYYDVMVDWLKQRINPH